MEPVNILCMKWGNRYGAEYVNILRSAVARHLTLAHHFICFTDDAAGFDPQIITYPIPELDMPERKRLTGWRKLGLFRDDLPLSGPCLFLDLDIVITGRLDDFFCYEPDKIPIIHNWTFGLRALTGQRPPVGNSSVFRFPGNQCGFVVEQYLREKDYALANFNPPQTYLTHCIRPKMCFWPDPWVRSFKRHCRPSFPLNLIRTPTLPQDARIIAFHGKPDPDEAAVGYRGKHPNHYSRAAPWVNANWR
ncbi:MAG: hypothetical protein RLZZ282_487 [Verrucomicrobiota bacterium]|jgi:hypothetical protein